MITGKCFLHEAKNIFKNNIFPITSLKENYLGYWDSNEEETLDRLNNILTKSGDMYFDYSKNSPKRLTRTPSSEELIKKYGINPA